MNLPQLKIFYDANPNMPFSRIPVYSKKMDNITGYVLKYMILEHIIKKNGNAPLSTIKRELLVSNRQTPIPELLETFISKSEHIAPCLLMNMGSISGGSDHGGHFRDLIGP